jgi:uncharacterized membrane protein
MIWLGWRQERRLALLAGIALQALAAGAFSRQSWFLDDPMAFLNGYYLGAVLIALAAWFSAWVIDRIEAREHAPIYQATAWLFAAWGTGWWLAGGVVEIGRLQPGDGLFSGLLLLMAGTTVLAMTAAARLSWVRIAGAGTLLAPALLLIATLSTILSEHPLAGFAWLCWPLAFGVHALFLKRWEGQFSGISRALHPLGVWALALVVAVELYWAVDRIADGVWAESAARAAIAALVLGGLSLRHRLAWPLQTHAKNYIAVALGLIVSLMLFAMFASNLRSNGDASPLPYLPLLNPLELVSLLTLFAAVKWFSAIEALFVSLRINNQVRVLVPVVIALFLLTMIVARSVHHFVGVPFDLERLAASDIFQAALSIVWGTTALLGMISGARFRRRGIWIGGAALMAIVVVKLFVVELGNTGTVERVVSFLGVGVLLLVVGYFAPVPPRAERADNATELPL